MIWSKVYEAVREETKYLVKISRDLVLFLVLVIIIMLFQRRILLPVLDCTVYYGEIGKLWLIISLHNLLTFTLLYYALYIIYYKGSWVSYQRCRVINLPDCRVWKSILQSQKARIIFGVLLSPIILFGLILNSLRLFGYPLSLDYLLLVLNVSISKMFGVFELGGYIVGILASALDNRSLRLLMIVMGAMFIVLGAHIEAVLIFELK